MGPMTAGGRSGQGSHANGTTAQQKQSSHAAGYLGEAALKTGAPPRPNKKKGSSAAGARAMKPEWNQQYSRPSYRTRHSSGSIAVSLGKTACGDVHEDEISRSGLGTASDIELGVEPPLLSCTEDISENAAAPAEELHRASLLRVAGFDSSAEEQTENDRWSCEYEYDSMSIVARCDEMTLLGMAPDFELFEFTDSKPSLEEVAPQKVGQAVLIQFLPSELCTGPWMQAILQQAGLQGYVMDCMLQGGHRSGEALMWFPNQELAEYAVWHFHGCDWTTGGHPVSACLVETAPMPEVSGELAEAATDRMLQVLLEPVQEWPRDADGKDVPVPLRLVIEMEVESQGPAEAMQPLSTIWEECQELIATEVSTDAGASGTSVASEAEDSHEGDESSDCGLRVCNEMEVLVQG